MRLYTLLLCMTVSVVAMIDDWPDNYMLWCDYGHAGNGGCEANGFNTYCVS